MVWEPCYIEDGEILLNERIGMKSIAAVAAFISGVYFNNALSN